MFLRNAIIRTAEATAVAKASTKTPLIYDNIMLQATTITLKVWLITSTIKQLMKLQTRDLLSSMVVNFDKHM